MRAIITPLGMPPQPFELETDPVWGNLELGGWGDATLTIKDIDPYTRSRLYRAEVEIQDEEPVYFGRVEKWDGDTITVKGWYDAHMEGAVAPRQAFYSFDSVSDWQTFNRIADEPNEAITVTNEPRAIRALFRKGQAYKDGDLSTSALFFPPMDSPKLKCSMAKNSANIDYIVQKITANPSDSEYGVTISTVYGTGQGTGAKEFTLSGSDIIGVRFIFKAVADYTPASANAYIRVSDPVIYGMGTTSPTPDFIAADIIAALGSEATPGGYEVSVDNTNVLVPFAFDSSTTERQKMERLLDYTDAHFRFENRLAGGIYRPGAVFRTPPMTPSYTLDAYAPEVTTKLVGGDVSTVVTDVRVMYSDKFGRTQWVDVTAPASNPLKAIGGTRWTSITADTTSASIATSVGNAFLAVYGVPQVRGTVEVTGRHNNIAPSAIEAARLVTLTNTEHGTVVARIKTADHVGADKVTLSLDNTPSLDDLLARRVLKIGTTQVRFNYVPYIDRRKSA